MYASTNPVLSRPRSFTADRSLRTIAVALHDVEPGTFERCALIRDWLDDHGVDRVTLLVIPAPDLHPLSSRATGIVEWLDERRCLGDAIAQHGFQHKQLRRPPWPRQITRGRGAEFAGLDGEEARRAVDAGRRVLKLAGLEPRGFVAPAYAYTPALLDVLASRFRWWASLLRVHCREPARSAPNQLAPAWRLGSTGPFGRAFSPLVARGAAIACRRTLRIDLHPDDLDHPRHMLALEWILARTGGQRVAITYDELAAIR